jgi:hypothetical protein
MKKIVLLIAILAATGFAGACADHQRPVTKPSVPVTETEKPKEVVKPSKTPGCFSERFLGDMPTERFKSRSPTAKLISIATTKGVNPKADDVVCDDIILNAGEGKGPSIDMHKSLTGEGWYLTGKCFRTVTNDDHTVGYTEWETMYQEYQPNYGWLLSCESDPFHPRKGKK